MIPIDSLLYKIDQRLNKLSSNAHQSIELEDKILALNDAQVILVRSKLSGFSAPSGLGMDSFNKRYEDLQNLVINYKDGILDLSLSDKKLNEWSADITKLDPTLFLYIDSYIIASKDRCKNRVIWTNRDLLKHGNLKMVLNNEHTKPSFEYQETCTSISSSKISVYTDGTFTPSKIYIMYLRYPKDVDKTGYVKFDGTDSINVDCELSKGLEDELLNTAVDRLAKSTENISAVGAAQSNLQKSD